MAKQIENKQQLVEVFESGCKPKDSWSIGVEHEKFVYHRDEFTPLKYKDETKPGIYDLLEAIKETETFATGYQEILDGDNLVGLSSNNGGSITLEPAGQLELSGAQLVNLHEVANETNIHLKSLRKVSDKLSIAFLGMGYHPELTAKSGNIPWMPKKRYDIMKKYMPKVGNLGLEMMQATCTVQVNLDFSSEEQMVKMFRVSLALQPIATALWANSPFFEGKPNGYKSLRSAIWLDTDADRTGMLPFVFENGFGFERYVDYLLDVPMYFIKRDGNYIDATGGTFRQFLAHKHEKLIGHDATIDDFLDHTTTVFPEVRLKQYLEMRGSDASRWKSINALPAFWVGLLYDDECLEQAWQYVKDWTDEERDYLRRNVPKHALNTEFRNKSVKNIAMDIVKIAYKGLKRRNVIANNGMDETVYLQFLLSMANSGMTQADELLCAYKNLWNEDVKRIYKEYSF